MKPDNKTKSYEPTPIQELENRQHCCSYLHPPFLISALCLPSEVTALLNFEWIVPLLFNFSFCQDGPSREYYLVCINTAKAWRPLPPNGSKVGAMEPRTAQLFSFFRSRHHVSSFPQRLGQSPEDSPGTCPQQSQNFLHSQNRCLSTQPLSETGSNFLPTQQEPVSWSFLACTMGKWGCPPYGWERPPPKAEEAQPRWLQTAVCESTATTSHSSSTRAKAESGQLPGRLHNLVSISTSKSPVLSPTSVKNHDFAIVFPESHVIVSIPSLLTKPLRTVKDLMVQSHCKLPKEPIGFTDAGRRSRSPGSETKDVITYTQQAARALCVCVGFRTSGFYGGMWWTGLERCLCT